MHGKAFDCSSSANSRKSTGIIKSKACESVCVYLNFFSGIGGSRIPGPLKRDPEPYNLQFLFCMVDVCMLVGAQASRAAAGPSPATASGRSSALGSFHTYGFP